MLIEDKDLLRVKILVFSSYEINVLKQNIYTSKNIDTNAFIDFIKELISSTLFVANLNFIMFKF